MLHIILPRRSLSWFDDTFDFKSSNMNPIETQLAELNSACLDYLNIGKSKEVLDKIRENFLDLVNKEYHVLIPTFEPDSAEFRALSENGKMLWQKMTDTRKKKLQAIAQSNYEYAADFRVVEREFQSQVLRDLSNETGNKFFVQLATDSKEIIFIDLDEKLKDLFRVR